jgi:hypothetical protein
MCLTSEAVNFYNNSEPDPILNPVLDGPGIFDQAANEAEEQEAAAAQRITYIAVEYIRAGSQGEQRRGIALIPSNLEPGTEIPIPGQIVAIHPVQQVS